MDMTRTIRALAGLAVAATCLAGCSVKKQEAPPLAGPSGPGWSESWIVYANPYIAGKELTVQPGCTAVVTDGAAYGCILLQGHGAVGVHAAETSVMLRYGGLSADEYFVSAPAAAAGVRIVNRSRWEPLVLLKHFGPDHPDVPLAVPETGC